MSDAAIEVCTCASGREVPHRNCPIHGCHAARRWRVDVEWFYGFGIGLYFGYGALWIQLGPMQVAIDRG